MTPLEITFHILGTAVIASPIALLCILGLSSLAGYKLGESVTSRLTQASVWLTSLPTVGIVVLMLATGIRYVPIELGNWVSIPEQHFHFHLKFAFDRLSIPFLLLSCTLCGVVGEFTRRYLHREEGYQRFFLFYAVFFCGMVLSSLASTIETLFVGWEMVGLSSALLVAYFHNRINPVRQAERIWSIYRLSDAALLVAAITMHHMTGEGDFGGLMSSGVWPEGSAAIDSSQALFVGVLILIAAAGKSALFPLSGWLPRAMEGPTPSSAIFYGALSVHLGAYLLLRLSPIIAASLTLQIMVISLGAVSAVCGAIMSRVQSDIKVSLAYASLTQVGVIVVEVGMGLHYLALIHIVGHACLRTMQLLRAPTLLRDVNDLENKIGARLPNETWSDAGHRRPKFGRWWYRFGFERGFMDVTLDTYVVRPFVCVASFCDRIERTITDKISSESSRESDNAELHPEKINRVA
ncbi:proton-conducting transporter membrane subunit [Planctomycetes bacterium K23_9]|uniref:NADH-quinone oxidoreductase subunit L n=1 Tax=Stieleria marina TaxID=1930275 RepID=A0A517NZG4_9BACT|nr:NADH-quinone oxidoreductase subunit L [Planctomycetes bacterium K23_9]